MFYFHFRYPKELENALEKSLEAMKSSVDDEETVLQFSQWTLEFVSLALSGFKSKVNSTCTDLCFLLKQRRIKNTPCVPSLKSTLKMKGHQRLVSHKMHR